MRTSTRLHSPHTRAAVGADSVPIRCRSFLTSLSPSLGARRPDGRWPGLPDDCDDYDMAFEFFVEVDMEDHAMVPSCALWQLRCSCTHAVCCIAAGTWWQSLHSWTKRPLRLDLTVTAARAPIQDLRSPQPSTRTAWCLSSLYGYSTSFFYYIQPIFNTRTN